MIKRPKKDRYVKSSASKRVALFWYTGANFIGIEDDIDGPSTITYGSSIQIDASHKEVWNDYHAQAPKPDVDWEYYPRGEVAFDSKFNKFVVVGDRKIVENPEVRKLVMFTYGLPDDTRFLYDSSYKSVAEV